jgi:acyl-CoA thioester hydrolase
VRLESRGVAPPFRYRLRVRYGECDAQQVVFNARYGDYADAAVIEYQRAVWGATTGPGAVDMKLMRQVKEWKAPARFDDVLEVLVTTAAIGTTSFTIRCEFRRWRDAALLATCETVYVAIGADGAKRALTAAERAALAAGAAGGLCDCAGTGAP